MKMVNRGTHEASRDFVALFVLDPAFGELRRKRGVVGEEDEERAWMKKVEGGIEVEEVEAWR